MRSQGKHIPLSLSVQTLSLAHGFHSCCSLHRTDTSFWCVLPPHLLSKSCPFLWDWAQVHAYMKPFLVLLIIVISLFSVLLSSQCPGDTVLAGFTEELLCWVSKLALSWPYFALLPSSQCLWQSLLGVPSTYFSLLYGSRNLSTWSPRK